MKSNWRKKKPKKKKKKGNSQNAHILEEIEKQELQRKQKGNETAERKSNHRTQKNRNKTKQSVSQFTFENTGPVAERDNLQMDFFSFLQFCTSVTTFNVIKFA